MLTNTSFRNPNTEENPEICETFTIWEYNMQFNIEKF